MHGGFKLALVRQESGDLPVDELGDIFGVVGCVGFPEQQAAWTVRRQLVFFEEVWIPRRHHTVARKQTGVAMIGMQAVTLPRVVSKHDVGSKLANPVRHLPALTQPAVEFAIRPTEKDNLTRRAECMRRGALFVLSGDGQCSGVRIRVPRALGAIGAHEVMHHASGRSPLCERCATTELDIIGMRPNGERNLRHVEVD